MKETILSLCIAFATVTTSCDKSKKTEEAQLETSQESAETQVLDQNPSEEYCFRNEIPYEDNPKMIDVEDLRFTVKGDSINGTFGWIPAEKGGIDGKIKGIKKGNMIEAVYDEIDSDIPFPITITLSGDNAEVTSSDKSFGTYTIKKSDCK